MTHPTLWHFVAALHQLALDDVSLRDAHAALRSVEDQESVLLDQSSGRVRTLAASWQQHAYFVPLRLVELFDGVDIEHGDDYVLAMIGHLGDRRSNRVRSWFLTHDHDLRETTFWRIFEVEGGGEVSLTNIDKFSAPGCGWHDTVLELVATGVLDRARVQRSCLEALTRDFSAYRAGWFSRVYTALSPTADEIGRDQDLLRLVLAAPITASVSLAVKSITTAHRAGSLDAEAFAVACPPVFGGAKSTALAAVRILTSMAPGPADVALAEALSHPHVDVQIAAGKALRAHGREDLVEGAAPMLEPSAAGALGVEPDRTLGVDEPVGLTDSGPTPVTPWSDEDAAVRFAALLEDASDAIEFESALAWLAESTDAPELLASLAKRARRRLDSDCARPAGLLLAVVEGGRLAGDTDSDLPILHTRMREVCSMARGRSPRRPLLAAPTDDAGFVDAVTLIRRYRAAVDSYVAAAPADLTQALLRVGEGRRDEAARMLADCPPGADRDRIERLLVDGDPGSPVTDHVEVEWLAHTWSWQEGEKTKSRTVYWPRTIAEKQWKDRLATAPGLIRSRGRSMWVDHATPLLVGEIGLVRPDDTLGLAAFGLLHLSNAAMVGAEVVYGDDAVLSALARHRGRWHPLTGQALGLALSAQRAELRAGAAELFADAVPARMSVAETAAALGECAPGCLPTRWAKSLADAATISDSVALAVVDVLTALLPQLDRSTRGIGDLMGLLLNESVRAGRTVADPALREWLAEFRGASGAAKTARALLAV